MLLPFFGGVTTADSRTIFMVQSGFVQRNCNEYATAAAKSATENVSTGHSCVSPYGSVRSCVMYGLTHK